MGVYYYYVNETKKQYFCIDPIEYSVKLHALGHNIGSRAMSYLLLNNANHYTGLNAHPLIGSWIGDRFYITGNDYDPDFPRIKAEYSDIGQDVMEMLTAVCPYDLLQYGGLDWLLAMIGEDGDCVQLTDEMRERLLVAFRHEIELGSRDDALERIIAALSSNNKR